MNKISNVPKAVVTATRLLWLVAIIGLIQYILEYMKPAHGMMSSTTSLVISCVILVCFVAFINYYLLKAKNWVRWLALVFTLISLPALLLPEVKNSPVNLLAGIITTALEFIAIYLTFSGDSKSWFK